MLNHNSHFPDEALDADPSTDSCQDGEEVPRAWDAKARLSPSPEMMSNKNSEVSVSLYLQGGGDSNTSQLASLQD